MRDPANVAGTLTVVAAQRLAILTLVIMLGGCVGDLNSEVASPTSIARPLTLHITRINPAPVLTRGPAGTWDSVDVLNPSVIRWKGELYNFYSGYDGAVWRTGVATSEDNGITWTKRPHPVLGPDSASWDVRYISGNGAAIVFNSQIYLYYQGWDQHNISRIGLAISSEGTNFIKEAHPVISGAPAGAWDAQIGDPYVIKIGRTLFLYYVGITADWSKSAIGVATSGDGIHWTKALQNPVLKIGDPGSFDEKGIGEPSVVYKAPYFYMLYTGSTSRESRDIGWAVSRDGFSWQKCSQGLFGPAMRQPWFSQAICDTTILLANSRGGQYYVWFGGGDIRSRNENMNGQIGRFTMELN